VTTNQPIVTKNVQFSLAIFGIDTLLPKFIGNCLSRGLVFRSAGPFGIYYQARVKKLAPFLLY